MAAPVDAKIQLPTDSGNTGPNVRTRSRVVGANTVHEHFFVQSTSGAILGVYSGQLSLQSVQAAAQNGTSTGFLWMHVPTAVTGKKARIRYIVLQHQISSATAMVSNPRIALARFTFTGTASGASITSGKIDSSNPSAVFDLRTAATGLTVTLGAVLSANLPPVLVQATAAAITVCPTVDTLLWRDGSEEDFLVLAPGEGAVIYQPDAGTAADARKFIGSILWDEVDTS